ncbi:MAG: hypothetical protein LAT64_14480 [Phycisphaerales bacterium]|nr:hypothetical protein [Planctomycetota bacterium]MCH8509955.1 hypothetical protein [Phycisphaerales bacterium]
MHLSLSTSGSFFEPCTWQPEVCSKLESHHLVAWSRDVRSRTRFAPSLQSYLQTQPATEVCILHGRAILDLESFCAQLERQILVDELARTIDGPRGVVAALRQRSLIPGRTPPRQRVLIWHDADVLCRARPGLFADLAEAITGVSAELEFASDAGIFVQRAVFLGPERLRDFARQPGSCFRTWKDDGGVPFWSLVSGLDRPPVSVCSIDALMEVPV